MAINFDFYRIFFFFTYARPNLTRVFCDINTRYKIRVRGKKLKARLENLSPYILERRFNILTSYVVKSNIPQLMVALSKTR